MAKNSLKTHIFGLEGRSRSSMLVPPERSSAVLVMIRSKSVSVCNRSDARRVVKLRFLKGRGFNCKFIVVNLLQSSTCAAMFSNKLDLIWFDLIYSVQFRGQCCHNVSAAFHVDRPQADQHDAPADGRQQQTALKVEVSKPKTILTDKQQQQQQQQSTSVPAQRSPCAKGFEYSSEVCFSLQGGPKKTAPNFSCNNFGKYGPILIMFSLLHSQMNWKKARLKSTTSPQICCCTTLWKLNAQLYSYLWTKTATFRRSWFTSRMYH